MTSHLLGIFLAAVAMFALGSVWFSPLMFVKVWAREAGVDISKKPDGRTMGRQFGMTFVLLLVSAAVLDCVMTSWAAGEGVSHGLSVGFLGGVLAATTTGINFVFENKSLKHYLINVGYDMVGFCMMGVVLALI
ncbi:MAG TPA: DUF1761 domain-containing protein [Gammaproteobacteria bacterium]|nr:DUF1761 domain-containing protein [Gammaproteobacteria bacterium]